MITCALFRPIGGERHAKMTKDTIFALSSGFGRAAIAVLRLSGPATRDILAAIIGRVPEPRRAVLARFKDPGSGEIIDRGLALFFPGPASETGEDCAEFHCHGGPAVIAAMLRMLSRFAGARLAEPGEFARRAFENGKLDLTEVEALGDLIAAETEAQRRQAVRQAQDGLGRKADAWRQELIKAAGLIEAGIDFVEEDIPEGTRSEIRATIAALGQRLRDELAAGHAGERLRDGVSVVIAGPPNAGKSTLLNALARREAAIVSAIPGTTRDAIEIHLDLHGLPVRMIDTAGLRDSHDAIEAIGIARAQEKTAEADLVLWLSEAAAPVAPSGFATKAKVWRLFTKSDLLEGSPPETPAREDIFLSAATGENINALIARLSKFAHEMTAGGEGALITRERHRRAMTLALAALERAESRELVEAPELLAEELRCAIRALESLIGKIDVEDVLGEIFSRFCIGK